MTRMPDSDAPPVDVLDAVPKDVPGRRRVVEVTVRYLEMKARPTTALAPPPPGVSVVRAVKPGARFYRYLYDAVGEPWQWWDRRRMHADELRAIVDDDRVEIWVLWQHGVPAGYAELDRRDPASVELAYFGLVPEAIGHKLGPWFLQWAIHEAWRPNAVRRVWVHTCDLDHPAAVATYQGAGFTQYDEQRHKQTVLDR